MDPNQKKNENHVLCPSDYNISEGQIETLINDEQKQQNKSSSWSNQASTKRRWLLIVCIVTTLITFSLSITNSDFRLFVGYPALASTLVYLFYKVIDEIIDHLGKPKK